jgi:gamma-glutamyltranspeptidase/glutathione hydrolase
MVYGQPPPSQGMVLIEELLLADGYPLADLPEAQRTHLLVEAKKLAFTDRNRFLGDPEWRDIAVEQLFDTMYISRRRAEIDPFLAAGTHIALPNEGSDTTYFVIVDDAGDAISWIQSVFHNFGSAWMPPGTGVLFNNRLTGFSLDQMSPNCIAPGKRPAHTLNAWLATHLDGRLAYVGGTPGGLVQVQTNLQLLVNAVDLKMDVQQAVEAPRWQHLSTAGALSNEETGDGILEIENRVDESIVLALQERGHDVRLIGPWAHGSAAQLMQVLPDGAYAFGSDPRCDGQAAGI